MGKRWSPDLATATGARRRLRGQATEAPDLLARLAESLAAAARDRCARGEHRTETDPETGDEVCRHCGTNTTAGSPDGR